MDDHKVGRMWDENAEVWTQLARAGFDVYRDLINTPAFLAMLPDVKGLCGLDDGEYFDQKPSRIDEWIFSNLPAELRGTLHPFKIPYFDRTLGAWIDLLLDTRFQSERLAEPHADEKTAAVHPQVSDTRIVAYFLIIRCRKPAIS